jgi:hypothetical protein
MMPIRRLLIAVTSMVTLFVLAALLATTFAARAPPQKIIQIKMAQAQKVEQSEREHIKGKGRIDETDFDRVDILNGSTTISPDRTRSTFYVSYTATSRMSTDEGMIGQTPTPEPSATSIDEGYIGPIETSTSEAPLPTPQTPSSQFPILALSYSGDGGPKHCRGDLLQKMHFPPPASTYKNGTCIDLPAMASCGVFFAGKDDNCEAQLFNMNGCMNTTETFVNTVVFMPEERAVGALWRSMYVRCGIDAPEAAILDPDLLSGLLQKPEAG